MDGPCFYYYIVMSLVFYVLNQLLSGILSKCIHTTRLYHFGYFLLFFSLHSPVSVAYSHSPFTLSSFPLFHMSVPLVHDFPPFPFSLTYVLFEVRTLFITVRKMPCQSYKVSPIPINALLYVRKLNQGNRLTALLVRFL